MNNLQKAMLCLFLLAIGTMTGLTAQAQGEKALYQEVLGAIRKASVYAYHYELNMDYPNGDKDKLSGEVYCDVPQARMVNKNTHTTTLLTGDWYLSAMHDKKSLVVYNLPKILAKEKRKPDALQKEFREGMQNGLPDSAMLRLGKVEKAVVNGQLVSLTVGFPAGGRLQRLSVIYNRGTQLLQEVRIVSFYPYDSHYGGTPLFKGKGITQEVLCSNYRRTFPDNVFSIAPYFRLAGGDKVVPVQFKDYKLTTNM